MLRDPVAQRVGGVACVVRFGQSVHALSLLRKRHRPDRPGGVGVA
jgi:hypothetical protein